MAKDALGAHALDELGISETNPADPGGADFGFRRRRRRCHADRRCGSMQVTVAIASLLLLRWPVAMRGGGHR